MSEFNLCEVDAEIRLRLANEVNNHIKHCGLPDGVEAVQDTIFQVVSCKASVFSEPIKYGIFSLLEVNMIEHYKQAWGWDRERKWKEMFSPLSHYILVQDNSYGDTDLVGFVHYQFTWDDEDEPEFPVIFCYELQINDKFQKLGLGRLLMEMLLDLSKFWKMDKLMLTCFKSNTDAMRFYEHIGYRVDENSPSKWGHDVPYEILSISPDALPASLLVPPTSTPTPPPPMSTVISIPTTELGSSDIDASRNDAHDVTNECTPDVGGNNLV